MLLLQIACEADGSPKNVSMGFSANSPYISVDADKLSYQVKKQVKKWNKMNEMLTSSIYEVNALAKQYKRFWKQLKHFFKRKRTSKQIDKEGKAEVIHDIEDKVGAVLGLQGRLAYLDSEFGAMSAFLSSKSSKRQVEKLFYLIKVADLSSVDEILQFFKVNIASALFK